VIPLLLTARTGWVRLWIPLIIVWLLLLPLVLFLLPFLVLASFLIGINAWRALRTFWQLLGALPGTSIELSERKHALALKIF
jgi:hypothetical protein